MATVTFPTCGTYITPGICNNVVSSTFLYDATLITTVLGCIHSVGKRYDFVGTPVITTDDYYFCSNSIYIYNETKQKKIER